MTPAATRTAVLGLWALLSCASCREAERALEAKPAVSSSAEGPLPGAPVLAAIRSAEYGRSSGAIPGGATTDHDTRVRRAAARALSRIGDARALASLSQTLGDEDGEVVAWSAYGLGVACEGREPATVRLLVARAASLDAETPRAGMPARLSPWRAIADALGRCGNDAAERSLVAWLKSTPDRAESAALALGRIAERRHGLDDATIVALLDAAAESDPVPTALYPFVHVEGLSEASKKRLHEVATRAVAAGGDRRFFAIRALGAAGALAFDQLSTWLADEHLPAPDRCAAAVTLGRMGRDAQASLGAAIARMVPSGTTLDERWLEASFAPLSAALGGLDDEVDAAREALVRLTELPVPKDAPAALLRRRVKLRCDAAAVLAGKASLSARLEHCDPDAHGRLGALATLRVLDRGELSSGRFDRWKELVGSSDLAVRRAALAVLPRHPEAPPATDVLVRALGAKEPGIVAQAARAVAALPAREDSREVALAAHRAGTAGDDASRDELVDAVAHAMDTARPPDQIEPRVALMDAARALAALSLRARVERYCGSDNVTLRRSAEVALHSLGVSGASCLPPAAPAAHAAPATPTRPVTLTFVTDAGRFALTLDPDLSPFAVERITALSRSGFYSGTVVHRVSPGFIVQLGDPVGDGSGGSGQPPLPSEGSPLEFGALSVGLALAGRDTGSSQLFVTLSPEPHLAGDYPLIGRADTDWAAVAPFDVVRAVEVRE